MPHSTSFSAVAFARVRGGVVSSILSLLAGTILILWDLILSLINVITPNLPEKHVIGKGKPGENGLWPTYIPPGAQDSRCSCPALNAMANHGIIPRSGRNITFRELNAALHNTYNFAPTFCFFVPHTIAGILDRDYWTDRLDLSDIDVHNGIEHDASLTREDSYHTHDQSKVSVKLVEDLLKSGTGPNGNLTVEDLSRYSALRRRVAKQTNPQFSLSFSHKMFGSSKYAV
ncbi:heme-thiolate peroxidase [Antrodiella citrinella]|uniref:Heme-thiolate peroxidase n=1 Tax=Antrodiella citrinella TaxID=2447956 RepID=A0A4S4MQ74_9APHY|nr:heme-thiolate peroxidase [Antrodiella citrinella]